MKFRGRIRGAYQLDPIKFRVNFSQDPCIRVVFHNSLRGFSFL